jgi:hypothetical protein
MRKIEGELKVWTELRIMEKELAPKEAMSPDYRTLYVVVK